MNCVLLRGVVVSPAEEMPRRPGQSLVVRLILRTTLRWYNTEGPREKNDFHTLQLRDGQARMALDYAKPGTTAEILGALNSLVIEGEYFSLVSVQKIEILRIKREKNPVCPPVLLKGIRQLKKLDK